ncbi:vWA domain-containing protein [Gracilinema caldarium]|nr:VWA domain-containing protein [Gracilinema caldarium]
MRKHHIAVLLAFFIGSINSITFANEQSSIDLVVVLDTSASMYVHNKEVSEFVIGPLLKDFLRYGDTFHLISFSSTAKTEISRKIEGIGDIETVIGRLLLLYPLDKYSDIVAALQYTGRYLRDLPENRLKTVVFITDGDQNPSPTSPNKGLSKEDLEKAIGEAASILKGNGWKFYYIRVPQDLSFRSNEIRKPIQGKEKTGRTDTGIGKTGEGSNKANSTEAQNSEVKTDSNAKALSEQGEKGKPVDSASATEDVSDLVTQELNIPITELNPEQGSEIISTTIGAISVIFPESVGKVTRDFSIPIRVNNPSSHSVYLETQAILVEGIDRLKRKSFKEIMPRSESVIDLYVGLPESYKPGSILLNIEPQFAGAIRINPSSALIRADLVENTLSSLVFKIAPLLFLIGGILFAGILAIIIIAVLRKLQKNPGLAMAEALHTTKEAAASVSASGQTTPAEKLDPGLRPAGRSAVNFNHTLQQAIYPEKDTSTVELMAAFAKKKAAEKQQGPNLPLQHTQVTSPVQSELPKKDAIKTSALLPAFSAFQESSSAGIATKPDLFSEPQLAIRRPTGRIMLNLFVQDQNTAIGKRNVHFMKAGHRLTLGGHNSDFLIFLVPLPHRIADVYFDGEQLTLIPRRPEFFPETGSEPLYNCVDTLIHIKSAKGYDLYIRFEKYQDPLQTLNSFLKSVEMPGTRIH